MIGSIENLLRRKRFPFVPSDFSVRFFASGTYHDLYLIEGNGNPLIFRLATYRDEWAGGGLATEHAVLQALPDGVAPRAHYIDCSLADFPAAFRIESFVCGSEAREFSPSLMHDLAECFVRIHSLRYPKAGVFPGKTDKYRVGGTMTALLRVQPDDPPPVAALIERTNAYIDRHSERYRDFRAFSLIHNDLHLPNVLRCTDGLRLIDWEHAECADPAQDIAILFWFETLMKGEVEPVTTELRECFFERYIELSGDEDIRWRTRLHEPVVLVLYALSGVRRKDRTVAKDFESALHFLESFPL